eukprot:c39052_g1_i1 orf=130-294(+)
MADGQSTPTWGKFQHPMQTVRTCKCLNPQLFEKFILKPKDYFYGINSSTLDHRI